MMASDASKSQLKDAQALSRNVLADVIAALDSTHTLLLDLEGQCADQAEKVSQILAHAQEELEKLPKT